MARHAATSLASVSLLLTVAAAPALASGEARVLDATGRVLTVGNWETITLDSGPLRVENELVLSFEYRDFDGSLLADGVVPGTDDSYIDGAPALSLDPVNGRMLAAWSRASESGTRELVAQSFGPEGFEPAPRILATGVTNQTDPDLIHDRAGNAYIAWRDMDWAQRIELIALDPEGTELFRTRISTEDTVQNGAPRLGVDATGALFVAYLGLDAATGAPRLRVHAASDIGGGVIHVPSPIIELGRVSELEVTDAVPAPGPSGWQAPALEVTILGGTPVLWWITEDDLGREQMNHAIRDVEGRWNEQPLGRIALTTLGDPQAAVRDALSMIEARYRSVFSLVADEPPVLAPRPGVGLAPSLRVNRR
jgi:hypothetical protein